MITLQEAWALIETHVKPAAPAEVPITSAWGCQLSDDVVSTIDVPGFACSMMDGVALRSSDLTGEGPWRLPIERVIAAGDEPPVVMSDGSAVKVMTGAPLPAQADTVIPIEEVGFESGQAVIRDKPSPGYYTRSRGDDVKQGELVFRSGTRLKPVDVGILASIGRTRVKVIPRPDIAIIPTGSEVVPPGEPLKPGQRYNSNDSVLHSLLRRDGYLDVTIKPPAGDAVESMMRIIYDSLVTHRVVLTGGGVSKGDFDYIPDVVQDLGGRIIFHWVNIKPGRPVLLARFNSLNEPAYTMGKGRSHFRTGARAGIGRSERWLVGLPGNPVSIVVAYHMFVKRVLAQLMGSRFTAEHIPARLARELRVTGDGLKVIGVRLEEGQRGVIAHPGERQDSGRMSSIKGIDGFIYVEPGDRMLKAGEKVKVEV